MGRPNLPLLAAHLAKVQHVVPRGHHASLTTLDGVPYVQVTNKHSSTLAEICEATDFVERLHEQDKARNFRRGARTKRARALQTRAASWK